MQECLEWNVSGNPELKMKVKGKVAGIAVGGDKKNVKQKTTHGFSFSNHINYIVDIHNVRNGNGSTAMCKHGGRSVQRSKRFRYSFICCFTPRIEPPPQCRQLVQYAHASAARIRNAVTFLKPMFAFNSQAYGTQLCCTRSEWKARLAMLKFASTVKRENCPAAMRQANVSRTAKHEGSEGDR